MSMSSEVVPDPTATFQLLFIERIEVLPDGLHTMEKAGECRCHCYIGASSVVCGSSKRFVLNSASTAATLDFFVFLVMDKASKHSLKISVATLAGQHLAVHFGNSQEMGTSADIRKTQVFLRNENNVLAVLSVQSASQPRWVQKHSKPIARAIGEAASITSKDAQANFVLQHSFPTKARALKESEYDLVEGAEEEGEEEERVEDEIVTPEPENNQEFREEPSRPAHAVAVSTDPPAGWGTSSQPRPPGSLVSTDREANPNRSDDQAGFGAAGRSDPSGKDETQDALPVDNQDRTDPKRAESAGIVHDPAKNPLERRDGERLAEVENADRDDGHRSVGESGPLSWAGSGETSEYDLAENNDDLSSIIGPSAQDGGMCVETVEIALAQLGEKQTQAQNAEPSRGTRNPILPSEMKVEQTPSQLIEPDALPGEREQIDLAAQASVNSNDSPPVQRKSSEKVCGAAAPPTPLVPIGTIDDSAAQRLKGPVVAHQPNPPALSRRVDLGNMAPNPNSTPYHCSAWPPLSAELAHEKEHASPRHETFAVSLPEDCLRRNECPPVLPKHKWTMGCGNAVFSAVPERRPLGKREQELENRRIVLSNKFEQEQARGISGRAQIIGSLQLGLFPSKSDSPGVKSAQPAHPPGSRTIRTREPQEFRVEVGEELTFRVIARSVRTRGVPSLNSTLGEELLQGQEFKVCGSVQSSDGFTYLELSERRGWVFNDARVQLVSTMAIRPDQETSAERPSEVPQNASDTDWHATSSESGLDINPQDRGHGTVHFGSLRRKGSRRRRESESKVQSLHSIEFEFDSPNAFPAEETFSSGEPCQAHGGLQREGVPPVSMATSSARTKTRPQQPSHEDRSRVSPARGQMDERNSCGEPRVRHRSDSARRNCKDDLHDRKATEIPPSRHPVADLSRYPVCPKRPRPHCRTQARSCDRDYDQDRGRYIRHGQRYGSVRVRFHSQDQAYNRDLLQQEGRSGFDRLSKNYPDLCTPRDLFAETRSSQKQKVSSSVVFAKALGGGCAYNRSELGGMARVGAAQARAAWADALAGPPAQHLARLPPELWPEFRRAPVSEHCSTIGTSTSDNEFGEEHTHEKAYPHGLSQATSSRQCSRPQLPSSRGQKSTYQVSGRGFFRNHRDETSATSKFRGASNFFGDDSRKREEEYASESRQQYSHSKTADRWGIERAVESFMLAPSRSSTRSKRRCEVAVQADGHREVAVQAGPPIFQQDLPENAQPLRFRSPKDLTRAAVDRASFQQTALGRTFTGNELACGFLEEGRISHPQLNRQQAFREGVSPPPPTDGLPIPTALLTPRGAVVQKGDRVCKPPLVDSAIAVEAAEGAAASLRSAVEVCQEGDTVDVLLALRRALGACEDALAAVTTTPPSSTEPCAEKHPDAAANNVAASAFPLEFPTKIPDFTGQGNLAAASTLSVESPAGIPNPTKLPATSMHRPRDQPGHSSRISRQPCPPYSPSPVCSAQGTPSALNKLTQWRVQAATNAIAAARAAATSCRLSSASPGPPGASACIRTHSPLHSAAGVHVKAASHAVASVGKTAQGCRPSTPRGRTEFSQDYGTQVANHHGPGPCLRPELAAPAAVVSHKQGGGPIMPGSGGFANPFRHADALWPKVSARLANVPSALQAGSSTSSQRAGHY